MFEQAIEITPIADRTTDFQRRIRPMMPFRDPNRLPLPPVDEALSLPFIIPLASEHQIFETIDGGRIAQACLTHTAAEPVRASVPHTPTRSTREEWLTPQGG